MNAIILASVVAVVIVIVIAVDVSHVLVTVIIIRSHPFMFGSSVLEPNFYLKK
jgi:hypothetical protein